MGFQANNIRYYIYDIRYDIILTKLLTNDFELYCTGNLRPALSILYRQFAAIPGFVWSVHIGDNQSRSLRLTNVKTWKASIHKRFAWRRISVCYGRRSLHINPLQRAKRGALQVVVPLQCSVCSFFNLCWVVWFLSPSERVHCSRVKGICLKSGGRNPETRIPNNSVVCLEILSFSNPYSLFRIPDSMI